MRGRGMRQQAKCPGTTMERQGREHRRPPKVDSDRKRSWEGNQGQLLQHNRAAQGHDAEQTGSRTAHEARSVQLHTGGRTRQRRSQKAQRKKPSAEQESQSTETVQRQKMQKTQEDVQEEHPITSQRNAKHPACKHPKHPAQRKGVKGRRNHAWGTGSVCKRRGPEIQRRYMRERNTLGPERGSWYRITISATNPEPIGKKGNQWHVHGGYGQGRCTHHLASRGTGAALPQRCVMSRRRCPAQ